VNLPGPPSYRSPSCVGFSRLGRSAIPVRHVRHQALAAGGGLAGRGDPGCHCMRRPLGPTHTVDAAELILGPNWVLGYPRCVPSYSYPRHLLSVSWVLHTQAVSSAVPIKVSTARESRLVSVLAIVSPPGPVVRHIPFGCLSSVNALRLAISTPCAWSRWRVSRAVRVVLADLMSHALSTSIAFLGVEHVTGAPRGLMDSSSGTDSGPRSWPLLGQAGG